MAYRGPKEFMRVVRQLGLMADVKEGVPRMAYHGVVTFKYGGAVVHLYDPAELSKLVA